MEGSSPFHAGEKQVQARLGVSAIEGWARKAVRGYLPEQHRAFHTSLPFLVAAARDERGRPWATLLVGREGFVTSPDPRSLRIDAAPLVGDALRGSLRPGRDLGLLGIELATRRRNRMNGRIGAGEGEGGEVLAFAVEQTFGNCPQHIHDRRWRRVDEPPGEPRKDERLSPAQRAWIDGADTFFIASGYRGEGESPTFGMDAAHRGGDPGFVRTEGDRRLVFPDYAGNNHYNTIGNLVLDPRAGLLFVEFATGSLLQLTGRMTIAWAPAASDRAAGAERMLTFDIEEVVELPRAVPLRWFVDSTPALSLVVAAKEVESADVTSFFLESADGAPLPPFVAGQHLPIAIPSEDGGALLERSYSLSGPPGASFYRISVKREPQGRASRRLHDDVEVGALVRAQAPQGELVLAQGDAPVVLVSAGVGITPMMSMLHALLREGGRRPVWFLHGARDEDHLPFAREVSAIAAKRGNVVTHTVLSRPRGVAEHVGRIDAATLARLDPPSHADFYLCGPTAFMASIQTMLEERGVDASRIHTETFGPVGATQA
jgi:ferredoxin-NADP reductase/predicted pyridoxine 5'-phosphate oxidase superfamily flavin-nucleotide-binding protein